MYPTPGALPGVSDLFVDGFLSGRVTERSQILIPNISNLNPRVSNIN